MNIDNINKTIETIKNSVGYSFDMGYFIRSIPHNQQKNDCGTSCCLAGFAVMAQKSRSIDPVERWDHSFFDIAMDYFGINEDVADRLFLPSNDAINLTDPKIGVKALELLRDTGEVLWDRDEFKIKD